MNCRKIKKRMSAYADGELPENIRSVMDEHLASCPACRERLGNLSGVWEVLNMLPDVSPATGFYARLDARRRRTEETVFHVWQRAAMALSVASVICLGIVTGSMLVRNGSSSTGSRAASQDWLAGLQLETLDEVPESSLSALYFSSPQNEADGEAADE